MLHQIDSKLNHCLIEAVNCLHCLLYTYSMVATSRCIVRDRLCLNERHGQSFPVLPFSWLAARSIGVKLDEKVGGPYPFISFALPFYLFPSPLKRGSGSNTPGKCCGFYFAVGEFLSIFEQQRGDFWFRVSS